MGVKNELFPLKCIWLLLHCLALPRWQVISVLLNEHLVHDSDICEVLTVHIVKTVVLRLILCACNIQ
jgi:hypothetical protein